MVGLFVVNKFFLYSYLVKSFKILKMFLVFLILQSFLAGLAASGALTSGLRLITKAAFENSKDGLRKGASKNSSPFYCCFLKLLPEILSKYNTCSLMLAPVGDSKLLRMICKYCTSIKYHNVISLIALIVRLTWNTILNTNEDSLRNLRIFGF